jgi:hypothetical protein
MIRSKLSNCSAISFVLAMAVMLTGCQAPLAAREAGKEELYLEIEQIPIDNCGGPAEVTVHRTITKTFYHEVYVETAAEANLNALVISGALAQKYGYQDGQEEERSFGVDLTAPANSKVIYVLRWSELWVRGNVYDPGTGKTQGTYRLRKDIHMRIVDSHTEPCP